ncbi:MAG: sugar ABC transporter permease [Firmicutes bacterium]|nr:sugar ABC transporter permease [Bacillota bacterium]
MVARRYYEVRGWLLASPYLVYTVVFFLVPIVWALWLAGMEWNLISPRRTWVGLKNLMEALGSPRVWAAFINSYKFLLFFLPVVLVLAVSIALLVNSLPWGAHWYTVLFFLPYLASGVATSLVAEGLIAVNGPLNLWLVRTFGFRPPWLESPGWATAIIVALIAWKFAGYYALIYLAALRSIPRDLYEAAAIDGAGPWTRFWRITWPNLYPATFTVVVLAVGLMFGIFTEPYVLTRGGPNLATHTWHLEIYHQAFANFRAGYASAVALLNAVCTFVGVAVVRWIMQRWGRAHGYEA